MSGVIRGSPSEENTKHAAAGVFCAPLGGSTLLPMSNAAEVQLEHKDGDIATPKSTHASLGYGYKAEDVKPHTLPPETITACLGLGLILRNIRARMLREGYNVPKGNRKIS